MRSGSQGGYFLFGGQGSEMSGPSTGVPPAQPPAPGGHSFAVDLSTCTSDQQSTHHITSLVRKGAIVFAMGTFRARRNYEPQVPSSRALGSSGNPILDAGFSLTTSARRVFRRGTPAVPSPRSDGICRDDQQKLASVAAHSHGNPWLTGCCLPQQVQMPHKACSSVCYLIWPSHLGRQICLDCHCPLYLCRPIP